jgi:hypothetical protein
MTVNIPDNDSLDFPAQLGVEETRRILIQMGYTQVEGASASVEDGGETITFARQSGGAKAAGR